MVTWYLVPIAALLLAAARAETRRRDDEEYEVWGNQGVLACEGKGLSSEECAAVGCCDYDGGQCWANGNGQCGPNAVPAPGDNDQMLQSTFGPSHTCAAMATAGKCFMKPSCLDGNNQPVPGSETWNMCQCADNAATNKFEGNLIQDAAGKQRFTTRETCENDDEFNNWKTTGCMGHPLIKYLCPTSCPPKTFGNKCVGGDGSVIVQPICKPGRGQPSSAIQLEEDCNFHDPPGDWELPKAYVAADYTKDANAIVKAMYGGTCSQGASLAFCAQAPAHPFLCPESCALLTNQNAVIAELQDMEIVSVKTCEDEFFDCSESVLAEYFCGKKCQQPIRYSEFVADNNAMLKVATKDAGATCAEKADYESCTTSPSAKAICPVSCLTKPAEHLCCGAADKDTTADKVSQACYAVLFEANFFGVPYNPGTPCASATDGDTTTKECKVELYKKFSCPVVPSECGRNSVTKDATCTCTDADLPCKVKHADSDFHDCYNVGAGGLPDGTSPVTPDDPKCVAKKAAKEETLSPASCVLPSASAVAVTAAVAAFFAP